MSPLQKVYTFKMPLTGYFYYTITPVYFNTDGVINDSTSWYINHEMYVNYKPYTGNMLKDDVDYWVFKAPKTGKYKISGVISDNDYYGTESKCSNEAYLNTFAYLGYQQKGNTTIDETSGYKTIFKGKDKKGKKIYIKIQYNNWYGVFYKLNVKKYNKNFCGQRVTIRSNEFTYFILKCLLALVCRFENSR